MVDLRLRVLSLLIISLLSAGILIAWYVGELFPWIHGPVYISVMLVVIALGLDINGVIRYYWSLIVLCLISVLFRTPMVLLPGTLSGNDPEKYALFARLTLATGSYVLPQQDFYGTAGAFHTYVAQTSVISGIVPEDAMVVIGLFFGLWAPLIAASFCVSMLGRSESGYRASILAAAVATVVAMNISMSFAPFAQSLGTMLFVTLVFVVIKQIDVNRPSFWVIILVLAAAMAVSHKLPLVVATPIAGVIWFMTRVSASDFVPWNPTHRYLPFWIVVVLGIATVVQQYVISSFLSDAVLLIQDTTSSPTLPQRTGIHPDAASVPDVGILQLFTSHMHAPATLFHAGLSWLLVLWGLLLKSRRPRGTVIAFLSAVALLVVLVVFTVGAAVVPAGINPFRIYALVELLIAGLIGVGILVARRRTRYIRALMMGIFVIVLIFNIFSATATPDFPSEERQYLTPEEVTAKRFAVDNVPGEIYTDNRYVRQTPYPERVREHTNPWIRLGGPPTGTRFNSINTELVNGTAVSAGYPTLMYRTNEDIYGSREFKSHRYQLEWDVEDVAGSQYHQVYDNGDTIIFRDTTI